MSNMDDSFPCNKASDDNSEDEEVPDGIIMDLYQEMIKSTWSGQVFLCREGGTYRVYRVIASTEGVKGPTESFFWHSEMGKKGK